MMIAEIKIKYFDDICRIEKFSVGDWIDLHSRINIRLHKGEYYVIPLGVAMELPRGYEAYIVPRSSTFKNFHLIQTNSIGIVDSTYNGDTDEWGMPVLAVDDTVIKAGNRICQFRVMPVMDIINFNEVDVLSNSSRGGFGTTGV